MAKKISGNDIVNGMDNNRTAFSLSAMTRETLTEQEEVDPNYDDFISNIAGEKEPASTRAKLDMNRLKEGEYVLQPAWSPMPIPSKDETVFHLDDEDDVPSVDSDETTEPR